ncbi:4-amino-4-deoxychorismate lyase [Shouchella clausii]|uniref:aminodeoxychorismate lyase n=1 Tax=Shouchella clausii TaxID=79880 RepID=UPI000BA5C38B|nr:aminodeoxychorismate lyase [Shouchella clausii]PAF12814.1 4-amino-4-deoxychorismate lyase [Shouchella clausii]
MFLSINGAVVAKEQAAISAFDHGFLYGIGLFETFAADKNGVFLLEAHIERLLKGLESVGIAYSLTKERALETIYTLLEANQLEEGYVRWNVSAGMREIGLFSDRYEAPTEIVYMKPLPKKPLRKEAVVLHTVRNTPEGGVRLKSHHYLNNVLAKQELKQSPHAEGIFLTKEGYVAEGIVSNLFWIKGDVVFTPSLETGILGGVTRSFVIKQLQSVGHEVRVGLFKAEALHKADALFLTNSIQGVVPVTKLDGRELEIGSLVPVIAANYTHAANGGSKTT